MRNNWHYTELIIPPRKNKILLVNVENASRPKLLFLKPEFHALPFKLCRPYFDAPLATYINTS